MATLARYGRHQFFTVQGPPLAASPPKGALFFARRLALREPVVKFAAGRTFGTIGSGGTAGSHFNVQPLAYIFLEPAVCLARQHAAPPRCPKYPQDLSPAGLQGYTSASNGGMGFESVSHFV